jgi:septation ring formation regulator EzrA
MVSSESLHISQLARVINPLVPSLPFSQKNEENAPYITEAKHRNDALENETLQLRTESSKLHEQASLLKQERSLIIDEVTLKVDRVAELQETNERIRSRIVKSPERLKRGLEDMGRQQGEMRGALRDGARRGRELATRLDVMAGLELVCPVHKREA